LALFSWPTVNPKIQDGGGAGGRHLDKHNNRNIPATAWPIFTKFGMMMQNGSVNHPIFKSF